MKVSELEFAYPEKLIATQPSYPPKTLLVNLTSESKEILPWTRVLELFQPGDLLVMNNSKVVPRRVFSGEKEILFIKEIKPHLWEVLFPSKSLKVGESFSLPGGVTATLKQKGRPQVLEVSETLRSGYFFEFGELPLPPYIQKARHSRHHQTEDARWYQTAFAKKEGSLAAPTAGLHFRSDDLQKLRDRGVELAEVTLHVGLGTFLPIQTENVADHPIHQEAFEVSQETVSLIEQKRAEGKRVFCLGTTTARVVETLARWKRSEDSDRIQLEEKNGTLFGETRIFLHPPKEFYWIDGLLTNFHQPGSTLLALLSAFAGWKTVRDAYRFAVENEFRLFSYGDLSVWIKK